MPSSGSAQQNLIKAIMLLTCSAFLFSLMGVCVRYASETVDNATVVFFRNFIGLFIFIPLIFKVVGKVVKYTLIIIVLYVLYQMFFK